VRDEENNQAYAAPRPIDSSRAVELALMRTVLAFDPFAEQVNLAANGEGFDITPAQHGQLRHSAAD
jgi:hypothetical protein